MRRLKWNGYQIICDRCGGTIEVPRTCLCEKCFAVLPESVRPRDLRFASSERVCSMCGCPFDTGARMDACDRCASTHPDSSHEAFGRSEDTIFSYCERCRGLQIVDRTAGVDRFTYYRTGSRQSASEPYLCPGTAAPPTEPSNAGCVHEWLLVQSLPPETGEPLEHDPARLFLSEELMDFVREQTRSGSATFWCWKCGVVCHSGESPSGPGFADGDA